MISDPNTVSWKEYVDSKFEAREKAFIAAFEAAEKAVLKAETSTDRRFEAVNEFRKALGDQTLSFITRAEYEVNHTSLKDKLETLQKILWIGLGIVIAFQFIASILAIFWKGISN